MAGGHPRPPAIQSLIPMSKSFPRKLLLLALAGHLMACFLVGISPALADDTCRLPATGFGSPNATLSDEEQAAAREIERRAATLADAYRAVERMLRELQVDPDRFADSGRAWIGIFHQNEVLVGIYRHVDDSFVVEDIYWTRDDPLLRARLEVAQMALAGTPQACSNSYGLLDVGISDEDGNQLLYALKLVDRARDMNHGINFRFVVADGEIEAVEQLGFVCRTTFATIEGLMSSVRESNIRRPDRVLRQIARQGPGFRAGSSVVNPDGVLPMETDLLKMLLYPDAPFETVEFVLRDKVFRIEWDNPVIPNRYTRAENPCRLVPRDEPTT